MRVQVPRQGEARYRCRLGARRLDAGNRLAFQLFEFSFTNRRDAIYTKDELVVDDDGRNIFALTSLLENQEMDVISATNGRSAIDIIQNTPELSIVLMDIMMPDMDGYETIGEIRKISQFHNLPILALTAKAMKGDREKCLDAGASDYIAKPVNTDQLLSLMRVWLFR